MDKVPEAIRLLREHAGGLEIDTRVADLEHGEFPIEPEAYDLICDFFYLQRDLFPAMRAGVRPGGLFAAAIHLREEGRAARFVMESGELRAEFAEWKVLYYSEGVEAGRSRPSARIIARKA